MTKSLLTKHLIGDKEYFIYYPVDLVYSIGTAVDYSYEFKGIPLILIKLTDKESGFYNLSTLPLEVYIDFSLTFTSPLDSIDYKFKEFVTKYVNYQFDLKDRKECIIFRKIIDLMTAKSQALFKTQMDKIEI